MKNFIFCAVFVFSKNISINPFQANFPILYPLTRPVKPFIFRFSSGSMKWENWPEMEKRIIKEVYKLPQTLVNYQVENR